MINIYPRFSVLMLIVFLLAGCQGKEYHFEFSEFDEATKIKVDYVRKIAPPLITDKPEKVTFAKEFVQKHPDGWKGPPPFSEIRPSFSFHLYFYKDDDIIGWFGLKDGGLTYKEYEKSIPREELIELFKVLEIPEENLTE